MGWNAFGALVAKGRQHLSLLANAAAMMGSTVATSGLGFVYWWLAAHYLPAESVGLASAAIATMGFLALAGDLGLGTLLMGQISRHPGRIGGLISAALITATLGSALLALLYLAVASIFFPGSDGISASASDAALFVSGVALTGLVLVLDQTLLALLKASWHVVRNVSFALTKLVLLGLMAWLGANSAIAIYATWAFGNLVSVAVLSILVAGCKGILIRRPDFALLGGLTGSILSHHALNVLSQASGLLMPLLVTHILSPRINAAFYAAWLLIGVAYLAPASLTTALFSVAARDTVLLGRRLRFTLGLSMVFSAVTIAGCAVLGSFALSLFNSSYADTAGVTFTLLAATMPAIVIKYHYIALKRIREEMAGALPVLAVGAAVELGAAAAGGNWFGLTGLSGAWLLACYLQAIWMLPMLWRASWVKVDISTT
jgi:O-antigen/teichoic acid export membrane protein